MIGGPVVKYGRGCGGRDADGRTARRQCRPYRADRRWRGSLLATVAIIPAALAPLGDALATKGADTRLSERIRRLKSHPPSAWIAMPPADQGMRGGGVAVAYFDGFEESRYSASAGRREKGSPLTSLRRLASPVQRCTFAPYSSVREASGQPPPCIEDFAASRLQLAIERRTSSSAARSSMPRASKGQGCWTLQVAISSFPNRAFRPLVSSLLRQSIEEVRPRGW